MGYSTNKGVVPIACEEIFNRVLEYKKKINFKREKIIYILLLD